MNAVEVCAVLLALAYVILAIQQRRICWIAAIASAMLYSHIFWQVSLYLEAVLQIFYIAMAVYGWSAYGVTSSNKVTTSQIQTWTGQQHLFACTAVVQSESDFGMGDARMDRRSVTFF